MKLARNGYGAILVELSRRNLETLLAKLDDKDSERTLTRWSDDLSEVVYVTAVSNEAHYSDREPGPVLVKGELV